MSSLAGALVPWNTDGPAVKHDATESENDEEMEDLFGNEDEEQPKQEE
jgi:hypothetical protein